MDTRRLSKILEKCPADMVKELARPVMEKYGVNVIRKPSKTLVMVRMRETVAKAQFYLGELLACETLVELEGQKGFSLQAGDDLDKTLCSAVLDALRKTDLPEWDTVAAALLEEEKRILQKEQEEIRRHAMSRVQFNTLDVNY